MARRVMPDAEHLQAAFAALRKSDWEPTVALALQHPVRGRLLRLWAARAAVGERIADITRRPPAVTQPEPPPWHAWRPRRRPGQHAVDLKRAAAGDRDDE